MEMSLNTTRDKMYHRLCHLYVFAEKAADFSAKNAIVRALEATLKRVIYKLPTWAHIRIIYGGTRNESTVRSLMMAMYSVHGQLDDMLPGWQKHFPSEFTYALCQRLLLHREISDSLKIEDFLEDDGRAKHVSLVYA